MINRRQAVFLIYSAFSGEINPPKNALFIEDVIP
jgi:hypothetical protein